MKTRILTFVLMFTAAAGFAQQDAQFTQYMYNTININPAYAGSRGALSIFGLHRTQWVGLDGAPVTNTLSMNTPINGSKLGLGLSFVNDRIGPTTENAISVDVSYTVPTSETFNLSFGLKGTGNFYGLDASKLDLDPTVPDDAALINYNKFTPNIGAGVYWHSDKSYIGLSVPNFIQNKKLNNSNGDNVAILQERINYYLIAGHVFDLNPNIKFKPAILTKMVTGSPLQVDVSGNFMFYDKFVLGAAYRWDAAMSALAGFQITDGLYLGYGYDLETTRLRKYNSGSHEVFLRFELFNNYNKIISPRFF
ncbi:type IX secretion system membrane protein PorP/SprF [Flavobacterium sp. CYK-55]|uniref:PorP/SprF family type IX secretion system membrane protein n=1 Tax=Flavobacterium sp. CYK-55 TaxID=2835529 RepID=UPI001BCF02B5|nr:type IX secretion system membrane protein PorP/SprF [Flavobacterium sp. CYK-55]MBS7787963.1 type IX secretion system membrane protein PorP/SprF [Flavobacterium sp. CYK-55]